MQGLDALQFGLFLACSIDNSALVNASGDYLNEVFTYQKKWSKLFRIAEAKRKQVMQNTQSQMLPNNK